MSELRHPAEEELLQYADGELAARAAADIRSHLETCWECRTALQELERVIGECIKYRKNVFQPHLPPPPRPWSDLYARFAEADASLGRQWRLPALHVWRWAPAALALLLVWLVADRWRHTPAVEAAEFLRKAAAAADTHPVRTRRLQIRTRTRSFTLPRTSLASTAGDSVGAMFVAAHYSWNNPLSARSYRAWRDGLADKHDEVSTPDPSLYRVQTTTASSDLSEASLTFRLQDLEAVEGRFEFRNHEWVEIAEVSEGPVPVEAATPTARVPAEAPSAPAMERTPQSTATASAEDELRILEALHQLGADLGEPVEVSRAGGRILVAGVGIPVERQRQIQSTLGSQPGVVLRFSDAPASAPGPAEINSTNPGTASATSGLRTRMENQLGGKPFLEQLTSELLEMSDAMMSRAYALRRLAAQMPQGVESELDPAGRQLLLNLYRDHLGMLTRQETEMEHVLDPVLRSLGAPREAADVRVVPSGAWQPATEELFQAARRVERRLAQMLDVAPADDGAAQLPAEVRLSLGELRATSSICERLTSQALSPASR